MGHKDTLEKLFHHDEMARKLEVELLESADRTGLIAALETATTAIRQEDSADATGRLAVIARLWGRLATTNAADQLAELMRDETDEVRRAAAEALAELAIEDFALFRRAANAILAAPAAGSELEELAFLLTEIDQEETVEVLLDMLDHESADVIAAALEVAGEWGWEKRVTRKLEALRADDRPVTFSDEEEGEVTLAVGELAAEVLEALSALGSHEG